MPNGYTCPVCHQLWREKANYADHLQDHWTTLIAAFAALHGRNREER